MTERIDSAFWSYEDLALLLSAILPCYVGAYMLVRVSGATSKEGQTLIFQGSLFALLLGALYLLVAWRYHKPFWRSLGWVRPVRGAWWSVVGSPLLAVTVSILGVVLRAPVVSDPVKDLITGRLSLFTVMAFAVVFGPIYEELLFRGFLLPSTGEDVRRGGRDCVEHDSLRAAARPAESMGVAAGDDGWDRGVGLRIREIPDRVHRGVHDSAFLFQLDAVRGVRGAARTLRESYNRSKPARRTFISSNAARTSGEVRARSSRSRLSLRRVRAARSSSPQRPGWHMNSVEPSGNALMRETSAAAS